LRFNYDTDGSDQHPETNEQTLQLLFGRYGPISSVKIMWPRTAEEFSRGHNSGFVSFMHREDAHAAFQNLHDTNIDGHVVRLTWGRAQRRSAHAMKPLPGQQYGSSIKPYGMDEAIRRADLTLPVVLVQPPLDLVRRKDINILARSILQQTDDSQDYLGILVSHSCGIRVNMTGMTVFTIDGDYIR
jgi:RNA recognition motif-containing protein